MTKQANEKFPDKHFSVADMHRLPFPDNSFDSAVSLYCPLSYSLEPENLLDEITRVLHPSGCIALMQYTLRVRHKLEVGGYSTATEDSIEKVFYTDKNLRQLMSPLENVQIIGINYFLNTYTRFVQTMNLGDEQSLDLFVQFLQKEKDFQTILPAEYARHMIGVGRKPTFGR